MKINKRKLKKNAKGYIKNLIRNKIFRENLISILRYNQFRYNDRYIGILKHKSIRGWP